MDALPPKKPIFRSQADPPKPPTPPKPRKPPKPRSKRSKILKSAAAQRRKEKHEAMLRRRRVARHVAKQTLDIVAEETFGPGGLTPARQEALAAVLVGPDAGPLHVTSATHLRHLVRKVREKFIGQADKYLDAHLNAVNGAIQEKDYDTAARHTEWALDRMADEDERVTAPPQQTKVIQPTQNNLNIGVPLGGLPPAKS